MAVVANSHPYQQWILWRISNASEGFQIFNLGTGLCAEASPASDGTVMVQSACQPVASSGNQLFQVFRDTEGRVALQKVNQPHASVIATPDKVLNAHLWLTDSSSPNAIWNLVPEAAVNVIGPRDVIGPWNVY